MKEDIRERVYMLASHILETHDTVRKTASIFGFSKSTVHHDVSTKLQTIDFSLFKQVKDILEENFAEKHLRGGQATKEKYLNMVEKNSI